MSGSTKAGIPAPPAPREPWTCARCSGSFTARPKGRAKDGRLLCEDCVRAVLQNKKRQTLNKATAVRPAVQAPEGPMTRHRAAHAAPPPEPEPAQDDQDDGLYALEPEPEAPKPTKVIIERPPCPVCGYDLTGVEGDTCPECAASISKATKRKEKKKEIRSATLSEYKKAIALTCIGLLVGAVISGGAAGDPLEALWPVLLTVVQTPIAYVVLMVCSFLWIGFDAGPVLTLVRLAAVFAIYNAIVSLINLIPYAASFSLMGAAFTGIKFFIFAGLLAKIMDLTFDDARLVAAINFVVTVIGGGIAVYWIISQLTP